MENETDRMEKNNAEKEERRKSIYINTSSTVMQGYSFDYLVQWSLQKAKIQKNEFGQNSVFLIAGCCRGDVPIR